MARSAAPAAAEYVRINCPMDAESLASAATFSGGRYAPGGPSGHVLRALCAAGRHDDPHPALIAAMRIALRRNA
jgi:hypothetical protein